LFPRFRKGDVMRKTGFLYDDRYLLHDTGKFHPEVPARLKALRKGIEEAGLMKDLIPLKAVPAEMKWIEMVHNASYIEEFKDTCASGGCEFMAADNQLCMASYDVAVLAVGGVLDTVRRVMSGEIDNAFCAIRPPGHHAETNRAMGFCYFNNVAIAAQYLLVQWGLQRVGIIDFDVHHGNGTQQIFEHEPGVFYYSIHEHPTFAFPGTGRDFERGSGNGYGFTKNSTALPGHGDEDYVAFFERDLLPAFENFMPEFILVSTGFDAHKDDDMADMELTTEGYARLMRMIMEMADRYSGGKIVSVLEGGYCLERLPELGADHVRILMNP